MPQEAKCNIQTKIVRSLSNGEEFLAYVDAVGHLDCPRRLLEWTAISARYASNGGG